MQDAFKYLKYSEMLTLCWWQLFNKKKLKTFIIGLQKGKSAHFAYEDARNS